MESKEKASLIAKVLDDRKASDLVVLDMERISLLADYFLLATGRTARQTKALMGYVDEAMSKEGFEPLNIEGRSEGEWILLDYGDVVVHLFTPRQREYYNLERLWKDAPRMDPIGQKQEQE